MKTKPFVLGVGCFLSVAIGLRADVDVSSVVRGAMSDPSSAPAVIALAVVENQASAIQLVAASVAAMPSEATAIVHDVLKVDPKQVSDIVRTAILAQPTLASQITSAAVSALPDQSAAIYDAAASAAVSAPNQTAAPSPDASEPLGTPNVTNGTSSPSISFPTQPIQPVALVSPSS
jgi:hypothetical protein